MTVRVPTFLLALSFTLGSAPFALSQGPELPKGMQQMIEGMTGMKLEQFQDASPSERKKLGEQMRDKIRSEIDMGLDLDELEKMPKDKARELVRKTMMEQMVGRNPVTSGEFTSSTIWTLPQPPAKGFRDGSIAMAAPDGLMIIPPDAVSTEFLLVVSDIAQRRILMQKTGIAHGETINIKALPALPKAIVVEVIDPVQREVLVRYRPVAPN